jgi:16S rRNA (uracil1498-N3)-methyltransferase
LKRFILSIEPDHGGIVRLTGDDYHYLVRVRRLAVGEYFPALLPCGQTGGEEVLIRVCSVEDGVLTGECCAADPATQAETALPPIILFQALPKGEKMDLIVRQAAEGALAEIVPFISAYSIPKMKGQGRNRAVVSEDEEGAPPLAAKKYARWARIIKEARQQSGSTTATAIRPPLSLDGLFSHWEALKQKRPKTLGLLFHHVPLAQASLHGYLDNDPEAVALAIGPEGGFSPAEADRFLAAGFKALTIGDTVLRTETAALYAAAAIRIILLERNAWEMKPHQFGNE